jgi:hypothetical protein
MANSQRQGYLDRAAFHKAMDLIALAQHVSGSRAATDKG